jgi:hypothetical protein
MKVKEMIKKLALAIIEAERGQLCPDTIKELVEIAK